MVAYIQAKPTGPSDEMVQTIDTFVFYHVKATISSRFHFLPKADLRECLTEFLPEKAVQFPRDATRSFVAHVIDVLGDDYYK